VVTTFEVAAWKVESSVVGIIVGDAIINTEGEWMMMK
jgi:hypothetical protein